MLRNTSDLTRYTLRAKDGEAGSIEDFYFDDEAWTIRYIVAETGTWLEGRNVLISPISLGTMDASKRTLEVKLTKTQIENSPPIDTHKPVSRQHETAYFDYYGYPYYWSGPYVWGPMAYPANLPAPTQTQTLAAEIKAAKGREQPEDPHLRSAKLVTGYYIGASDGEIGHVEDFIVDNESWTIRYMVVDTRNWWPGKKVVISPEWIGNVSWTDSTVYVELTRGAIKNAPEYDPSRPIDRDYEARLHQHYGRQGYWAE
jgi:hypothetical protein